ncbi:hypothetical protein CEXT_716741 [Caerostris extrusa]|uniref:Uncharacterized protein n=1 Tax=Caerostris extrusa TaxID=172846 RepID=A0AAV4RJB9_CAEEX|nr:hypothetical protein CEXT_716741 [Caerostris extrusa]
MDFHPPIPRWYRFILPHPPPLSNLLSFISIGSVFSITIPQTPVSIFSPRYSSAAQPRWRPGRLTSFTSTSSDAGCHGDGSKRRGKVGCLAVIGWEPSGRPLIIIPEGKRPGDTLKGRNQYR